MSLYFQNTRVIHFIYYHLVYNILLLFLHCITIYPLSLLNSKYITNSPLIFYLISIIFPILHHPYLPNLHSYIPPLFLYIPKYHVSIPIYFKTMLVFLVKLHLQVHSFWAVLYQIINLN